jgi:hypothetical protein
VWVALGLYIPNSVARNIDNTSNSGEIEGWFRNRLSGDSRKCVGVEKGAIFDAVSVLDAIVK